MTAVMSGIRIVEVAEHTFVPAASAIMSDWGADVIKIEHVERGDAMRGLASTGVIPLTDGVHALLEHSNRGKRSLALDLSRPEGLAILHKLVASSDVFITNKLPAVRERLGLDVDSLRAHNPALVYVRGSGYGQKGPDADRGGYDVLGYWCRSGLAMGAKLQEVDMIPAQPAPAYGDSIGAMTIAGGVAAALLHRERTGEATVVDVSLLATGMWAMGAGIALSLQLGVPWQQSLASRETLSNPLTASYRTKDGHWLFLSCLQGFHYWPEVCRVVNRMDLVEDDRFNTAENLMSHAPEALGLLEKEFVQKTLEEWKSLLRDFAGQWAPVQTTLEIPNDEQVIANGYLVEAETKEGVRFPLVSTPVQFDGNPSPTRRAPEFNEHGDDILVSDVGLEWDEIIDLKLKGVVA
jgi:crotonobetainyl-CoA:carnitine CoA-transferase CaiB-like acyl-CoA transferase